MSHCSAIPRMVETVSGMKLIKNKISKFIDNFGYMRVKMIVTLIPLKLKCMIENVYMDMIISFRWRIDAILIL